MPDPQTIHDLETPSVLIDLDVMERNIATMQARCDALGLQFRPHIKTHKLPEIAHMQLDAGAVGIACQKVSEAEVFADAGITDIQLPYNIVGEKKTARLAQLAKRARVTVTVDSKATVDGLAKAMQQAGATLNVMVEIVSMERRTGSTTPEDVLELAQHIIAQNNLNFVGVMIYPSIAAVRPRLQAVLKLLADNDIPVQMVSGGGLGSILEADQLPELTELRIGTYVFNDWGSVDKGWANLEDCAMRVRVTVVSANEKDRVILDSGSKTLSSDNRNGLYGYIEEYPQARIHRLNEEHAYTDFSACEGMPQVGDILHIIPAHTCVVTNLHNQIYGVRGETIEKIWPVAARGLVW
ncbi:MAG: alanine racemase [Anaerolineaceae bacterium]|nr:alanine racemase [Anaerolineaceae bacterium]